MSAPAHVAPPLRTADSRDPTLDLALARGVALTVLAAFGALHWMAMLEPAGTARAWYAVGIAVLAMVGLRAAARAPGRARPAVAAAVAVAAVALALPAGGVADELLRPDRWGDLAAGIGRGISALPGARVPYRGLDEWLRAVLGLGGTTLTVLAALTAFWPRAHTLGLRHVALVLLVGLYVIPAVALNFEGEFLRGAVLALLVLAYLRLETLRVSDAGAAGALAGGVVVLAMMVAPALDSAKPWWDYEHWALTTASAKSTSFSWDHTYGPLDWPRDGRELLRVKARQAAYWKAQNLDVFDGRFWVHDRPTTAENCGFDGDFVTDASVRRWLQPISVDVRNLRTRTFVTAGVACALEAPRLPYLPLGDGTYAMATRDLRRGDAYGARVYTPAPTERQRRTAGSAYPAAMERYRSIRLPATGPDPESGEERSDQIVTFAEWDEPFGPTVRPDNEFEGRRERDESRPERAEPLLEASQYRRTWQLAQRLRSGARTQEDYVARVERYLGRGFGYTETPPPSASNLDGFLFDAKTGYCQQFSGAMALLLRMGGVPARVATGFTSGSYDREAREYVVRDLDAHSWVEVWYPGFGWVTFDPTPAASPARSQPSDSGNLGGAAGISRAPNLGGEIRSDPSRFAPTAGGGTPWERIALLAALAAIALAAAAALLRRRRGDRAAHGPLAELERALRRMRRAPGPGMTLHGLETRFAHTPAAAGYVRAIREQRYSGRPATPTKAQRRALRSELARGNGLGGRLRAWWALPPRPR